MYPRWPRGHEAKPKVRTCRGERPQGCFHPAGFVTDVSGSRGLEPGKGPKKGPPGRRACCSHPHPTTTLCPFMGLAQLRKARDPWDPELVSCLSFPSCASCPCLAPPKPNIFLEYRETPDSHRGGLMVRGAPRPSGAPARPAVPPPSWLCPPNSSPPGTVCRPGLWQAQVSAPVITRKVELAPLPR